MPEKFNEALGVIDGVNRDFSTSSSYLTGTLRVLRNGRLVTRDLEDGFEELSPLSKTFRMKLPPVDGDTLFVFYGEG